MNEIQRIAVPGNWIPLLDYAIKNSVSLSTLRRHIKAQKVTYKVENGRYLLWDCEGREDVPPRELTPLPQDSLEMLRQDLRRAHEESAELTMLIALYEEKIPPQRLDN
jgi:hypothetical protein